MQDMAHTGNGLVIVELMGLIDPGGAFGENLDDQCRLGGGDVVRILRAAIDGDVAVADIARWRNDFHIAAKRVAF